MSVSPLRGKHRGRIVLRREPLFWQMLGYGITAVASIFLVSGPGPIAVRIASALILVGLGVQWWALRPTLAAWAELRWEAEEQEREGAHEGHAGHDESGQVRPADVRPRPDA